ncbi:autotransporter outer membrane beta-barrel domain-containing protein [Pseudomonas sp. FEN]|uniref:autotransporter family protein n=1 Tax=Pseudomonas sp. FEN TaxID=2767468 RepID=UPI001748CAB8|nr:autotransporter outer membrane beta-barrel domain-containing protein [Pseudomonas sp. FEN]
MSPTPHRLALAITLALTTLVLRDTQANPIGTSSAASEQDRASARAAVMNTSSLHATKGDAITLSGASVDYTNHRDGEIQAITGSAIKLSGRSTGRIVNDGKVTSEQHDGIELGASDVAVINNKVVTGGRHGISTRGQAELVNRDRVSGLNGAGFHSAGSGKITNYGSLTGDAVSLDADGDGIRIKTSAEIHNSGQIVGKGSRGVDQYGAVHTSEGIAIGGGTIIQYAKGSISGADHGIVVSDGNQNPAQQSTALENNGTIHGQQGFAVQFIGEQADRVTNNGLIHGGNGHALDLGGGDDTLIVQANSRFEGSVDGNTGYDRVILDSPAGGRFGDSHNFERLEVRQGRWSLSGQTLFSNSIEIFPEAQLAARDGTGLRIEGGTHLLNRGTVTGTTATVDSDADGLRARGRVYIDNHGRITGSGANGFDRGHRPGGDSASPRHSSEGVYLDGGRLSNHKGAEIEGQHNGILADQRTTSLLLENDGSIRGLDGFGVNLVGQFADTVISNGLISGGNGVALNLGGESDTLIVKSGSQFSGWVDGGTTDDYLENFLLGANPDTPLKANDDLVVLDDAQGGSFGNSRHFERLQVRTGTWTLTSQDDFSSGAEILAHTHLINRGGILGTARVSNGASYSGNGTVGQLWVAGTLKVDPLEGAARVKEHLTLDPGATLSYGIDANGNSATVEVGGSAHLDGARLYVLAANESPTSQRHTVIKAGKLEGKFAEISSNLALMTATAHYTPTQVDITYKRNEVNLEDLGNTENGQNVGGALNPWIEPSPPAAAPVITPEPVIPAPAITPPEPIAPAPAITPPEPVAQRDQDIELSDSPAAPDSPLRHALRYISAVEAGQALEQLSGGSNAQLRNATLSGSRQVGSSLLAVMRQTEFLPGQGSKTLQVMNGGHSRLWVQGLGNSARFDSNHGHHGLRQSTRGLLLGVDWALDSEWRLGILGGQSQSDFKGQRFTAGLDSWHVGAYALRQSGPLALRLGAVYSSHSGKTEHNLAFNGYRDRLKGDYDANSQQAFAELGYTFGAAGLSLEPFAGLGYERYQRDSFKQSGGEAALDVSAQTHGNFNSTFGLRASAITVLDNKMSLTPRLSAGWKHLYGDVDSTTEQKLAVTDRAFKVKGAALDRDSLLLEAGLDLHLSSSQSLGVGYTGEVGGNSRQHGVMGQWRLTF